MLLQERLPVVWSISGRVVAGLWRSGDIWSVLGLLQPVTGASGHKQIYLNEVLTPVLLGHSDTLVAATFHSVSPKNFRKQRRNYRTTGELTRCDDATGVRTAQHR